MPRLMLNKSFYIVVLTILCGCGASEPVAMKDATPPPGYNPLFMTGTLPYSKSTKDPALFLSRIEANGPSKIKLYAHLVDSSGNYLSGASKMKNLWCRLVDVCNNKRNEIKDFKIKEVTEDMKTPVAIALVMDHSGSMGDLRAHAVQDAADKFISFLKPEDALALIKYDSKVVVEAPLESDQNILRTELKKNGLQGFGGYTAIADGIAAGIDIVTKSKYDRHAIVVFTDGRDNSSKIMRDSVVKLAKRTNTIICAVDFGENIDKTYMNFIATATGGIHSQVYRTSEFDLVFGDIYRKLKNYYVLEYAPREFGEHKVSLKLCLPYDTAYAEQTFDNAPKIGEISLLDVNFDLNKASILSESIPSIENAEYLLKAFPTMTIELRGHTDNSNNTGDPDYNKKLSQKRADAVKAELVKRGITADRIKSLGLGDSVPIADNTSEDGRARNRRTEFVTVSR
jgi:outer membrane protein OmpA-like peptidoglycan-associated protein/Mg-chelatase subunit ChlD